MQPERATDAYWLAMIRADVVTRHSGSDQWQGGGMDPRIDANQPLRNGGGPVIWTLVRDKYFSLLLSQVGLNRLVDLYGGRDSRPRAARGEGRWLTWPENITITITILLFQTAI